MQTIARMAGSGVFCLAILWDSSRFRPMVNAQAPLFRFKFSGLLLCAGMLGLCACQTYSFKPGASMPPPQMASFNNDLSHEYEVLADFITEQPVTTKTADKFYEKSKEAARGQSVNPELIEKHKVPAFAVHDLMTARQALMEAINLANVPDNAKVLAMAQAKFDCWIVFQPYYKSPKDYIGCREAFHQAMALVDMSKRKAVAPLNATSGYTIKFADEVVVLNQESRDMIEMIAAAALEDEGTVIVLNGHSKTKVTVEDTINNSVRRIIAVRNALYQNGVERDLVEVKFDNTGSALDVDVVLKKGAAKPSS